jgi:hypothetical protein
MILHLVVLAIVIASAGVGYLLKTAAGRKDLAEIKAEALKLEAAGVKEAEALVEKIKNL